MLTPFKTDKLKEYEITVFQAGSGNYCQAKEVFLRKENRQFHMKPNYQQLKHMKTLEVLV